MKSSTQVFTRLMDAALLSGLVLGNADVKVFAFWMVSIMAALMFAGLFAITPELAEKIQGRYANPLRWRTPWLSTESVLCACRWWMRQTA